MADDGQELTITRTSGTTLPALGTASIVLSGVVNPLVTGATGDFGIETNTVGLGKIDEKTDVAGVNIAAAALTATLVVPDSLVAGVTGNVTVTFTVTNPVDNNDKILVTFPANFNVAGVGWVINGVNLDGNASAAASRAKAAR